MSTTVELKHPEYKYIDFAGRDVYNRNNIIELTELSNSVNKLNGEQCFRTVHRFNQDLLGYVPNNKNSISKYDGECFADFLPIEIDGGAKTENPRVTLEKALEITNEVIDIFQKEYGIDPEYLKYFYSGNRSIHLEIPIGLFGDIHPHKNFNRYMQAIAQRLVGQIEIDLAMYDKTRLYRIVNTKYNTTGLYKIPLSYSDVLLGSVDKIIDLAKLPRELDTSNNGSIAINEKLAKLFSEVKEEIDNKPQYERKEKKAGETVYPKEEKYCIWKINQEGAVEGYRNDAIVRTVSYYKQKGHSEEAVLGIVLDWNSRGQTPATEGDVISRVADCYKSNYDFGCNDHLLSKYCSRECGFYKKKKDTAEDQYSKDNFILGNIKEKKNRYVAIEYDKDKKIEIPISNYVIHPKLYIVTEEGHFIEADIIGTCGNTSILILPPEIWSSKQAFTKYIDQLRWTQFTGCGNQVQYIKGLVCQKADIAEKKGVRVLGEHNGLFLIGKQVITKDGIVDNSPIVYLPRSSESNDIAGKLKYIHLEESNYRKLIHTIYSNILNVNKPEVTIPNIGWWFATPFRPRIMQTEKQFPALSVFGGPGSGKTTFQKILAKLFGMEPDLYSATEKPFVLLYLASSTNAIPIILDEYKPWKMTPEKLDNLHRIIRLNYNGSIEGRGKPDQTIVSYPITAPLAIVGEGSFLEEALWERIIPCCLTKATLKEECYTKACNILYSLPLNGFTDRYISWTLRQDFISLWQEAEDILNNHLEKSVHLRIRYNLKVMVFGIKAFELYGKEWGIDLPNDIGLDSAIDNCINLLMGEKEAVTSPLDYFIEKLSVMANNGKIKYGDHYYIQDDKLYIHLGSCYGEFKKYARESNLEGEIVNETEYKRLFRENKENNGYVTNTSESTNWGIYGGKRAYILDINKIEDMSGFEYGIMKKEEELKKNNGSYR